MAIELPAAAQAEVAHATAPLRGLDDALRWTRTENLHLTLAFLGEMPEERVPALTEALTGAAARVAPFALRLAGVGGFPGLSRPRVVWASAEAPDARSPYRSWRSGPGRLNWKRRLKWKRLP